ncbi:MAG: beta-glucosidase, partial [Bacteroidales bacterium]|nr:beta-glucosidase [Bacteroidales bacterium]
MYKTLIYYVSILATMVLAVTSCACSHNEAGENNIPGKSETRPSEFANDDEFLDYIQKVHLNYMWEGAESTSGLACERIHLDGNYPQNDKDVVTIGGSGFGLAGLIVAIDRGFITREEGVKRLTKIVDYLAKADRFHGVWPHWLDGPTGKVKPFGQKDNGGDLVESCFLMESLLCARQYFREGNDDEK